MIMRVLVTGSNGQVGFLLKQLLNDSVELLALTRQEFDITNEEAVNETVSNFKPQVIINAAAYTAVDKAESEEYIAYSVNGDGPKFLAQAASNIDSVLIHISTDYVFEGNASGQYIETDPVNPQGIYGKSKLAGEDAVAENCSKHLILRTAWVFGEHGNNFVKTMLRLAKDRDELGIVNDQFGGPTYAGDIAKAIVSIVDKISKDKVVNWGIYHYSGAPYVNWYEFAKNIFEKAEQNGAIEKAPNLSGISSEQFPTPAKRPENSKLSCEKIHSEFGILPSNWRAELDNIKNYLN
jgi:dTDP-4-dehydrorhamnose reductase